MRAVHSRGTPILLAGTENSANGIRWLILVIGSK